VTISGSSPEGADDRPQPSEDSLDPPHHSVIAAVRTALAEDLGSLGDLSASLVPRTARARVRIVARAAGVVAGRACAEEVFCQVDPALRVDWRAPDGSSVERGTVVAEVTGPARSVLSAERTALNFLCHLSGVATLTRRFVEAVGSTNRATRVLDTRKTTPGLRALEKAAVRAGGGCNHRASLSDAVLIKDNHRGYLDVADAVARAGRRWPGRMVEVECDTADQVADALAAGASAVLLDNMSPAEVSRCVALVRSAAGSGRATLVEVSGGVTLDTAPAYAAAGADLISVGALTHSAPILDLGFDLPEE
jgi:nicotinate-nucleotide pyrophosphorylase (carboxylating)